MAYVKVVTSLFLLVFLMGCTHTTLIDGDGSTVVTDDGGSTEVTWTTLFEDSFDEGFLTSKWATLDEVEIDETVGLPGSVQSLHLNNSDKVTTAVNPFDSSQGLVFSTSISIDDIGERGVIGVGVMDQGRRSGRAVLQIQRASADSNAVMIWYRLYPLSAPQTIQTEQVILEPGFHKFDVYIFSDGYMRWNRDGVQKLATLEGIEAIHGDMLYSLEVSNAEAHFDGVEIATPR